ncbi:MAG TPA: hypothetical protein VNO82_23055 [Solirubrobacteraceae bacterium]|nr:hypothetical protein [Solirubrobacteraceae bacterium]
MSAETIAGVRSRPAGRLGRTLESWNGPLHRRALLIFMVVVIAHWVEHLFQLFQVGVLGWARADSNGALGLLWPWLVKTEYLHYAYAIAMLIGLILLRPGFTGRARTWWDAALALQVWHHLEHLLLLVQVAASNPFFGAAKPTSIAQLAFPRIELHLFYNAVVFTPMVAACYLQYLSDSGAPSRRRTSTG